MGNDPALNAEFVKAMAPLYAKYSGNLDVAAIYAEGLMNLKPWALWNKDTSTGESTVSANYRPLPPRPSRPRIPPGR